MTAFHSRPLPDSIGTILRERLAAEHVASPFSPLDPRSAARRVVDVVADLGATATVYRGTLDLRGSEVDHVWIGVDDRVVDVTFPVFVREFVDVLRDFVAGDADTADLAEAAEGAGLDARVLGIFPPPLRYRGAPVWAARHR